MERIEKITLINKLLDLNAKEFAELIGISAPNYSQMKKGTRPAGDAIVNKLCVQLNIKKEWFEKWDGNSADPAIDSIRSFLKGDKTPIEPNARLIETAGFMNVPLVHVRAQCGYLCGYGDDEYVGTLPTLPTIVDRTYKGKYRLFEAEGDSMDDGTRNAICDGDIVLGREVQRHLWLSKLHINDWYFIIVHRTDGISIKKIIDHDVEHGIITCHPLNSLFRDYTVELNEVSELYNLVKIVDRNARL